MRDRDLADSSLASEIPDLAAELDTVGDLIRDAIAPYVPPQHRASAFAAIDEVLDTAERSRREDADFLKDSPSAVGGKQLLAIFEFLRGVYGDTRLPEEVRRKAAAAGIGANDPFFGNSYQWYGDEFGVTRACIHSDARDVQKKLGLRARRDKKDEAREKSRLLASRPRSAPTSGVQVKRPGRMFSFFPGL
jgi:hypothetical protein